MKIIQVVLAFFLAAIYSCAPAPKENLYDPVSTIAIAATDTEDSILLKAAHVVPTRNQYEALKNEFIAFIHFGPNTFTKMEWGNGMEDPKIFNLKQLDTDQWCAAMKAAGMKMVILTAKHHDGFVLWQSRYTTHGVMSTPFQEGKGDIMKDLSASCKKYGLKLGIYLSPADLFQIESKTGLYGNLSPVTKRTIPRVVEGRPFSDTTRFEFEVDDYNEYFLNQLFELLTEYGPIDEVWFDGAHPKTKGGQQYNYLAWKKLIHTLAPNAVVFGKQDIRWCGNEAGRTRETEWNVIPYGEDPAQMNNFPDLTADSLGHPEQLKTAKYLHYQQAETNTSIREGWFYRDDTEQKVRSADDVFDIYERSVGGNSTFLLNIPPNREGKFSPEDVAVLEEVGRRITATYSDNLIQNSTAIAGLTDKNDETYYFLNDSTDVIAFKTPQPVTINRFVIQEAVKTHGERVAGHILEARINNEWKEIARATNIGYKRILRFPEITADEFRLRVTASRYHPAITEISAHYYKTRPPQLGFNRNKSGLVEISPEKKQFNWNPHGQNAGENINSGIKIYYTTDGTEPSEQSTLYKEPFEFNGGTLKAVAFANNEKGAIAKDQLGISPVEWKLMKASPSEIQLDLGGGYNVSGFAYLPPVHTKRGLIEKGEIFISLDSVRWQSAGKFEFGNIVNDPGKRRYNFATPKQCRYIRIITKSVGESSRDLSMHNFDILQ